MLNTMHAKYANKWPKNVSFVQETKFYQQGEVSKVATWYEAIQFPNLFRIDIDSIGSKIMTLHVSDSVFTYMKSTRRVARLDQMGLVLLVGGVYTQEVSKTTQALMALKYNLNASFLTEWRGRKVLIIGANGPGEHVNQFWVDTKTHLVVRIMHAFTQSGVLDFQLDKFVKIGKGGFLATQLKIYQNQELYQEENYRQIKVDRSFPANMFHPTEAINTIWEP